MMPLKIFEERYQAMLQQALTGNRMFAIAHTAEDEEASESVGMLGLVRACVTNEDSSSNLVLQGVSRVRFEKIRFDPYPQSRIAILSDPLGSSPARESLRKGITAIFKIRASEDYQIPEAYVQNLESTPNYGAFTDIVASTAIQNPESRRALLEELDITARMKLLLALLQDGASS